MSIEDTFDKAKASSGFPKKYEFWLKDILAMVITLTHAAVIA